ncbi:uncharacterized protein [Physcomitrium patens]|uniref:non-specific serine/threonine protein kinase n=1 Tax=Physcomitrium patens TaxID=3218 RepID=A0A2K1L974_PHYPA|nr:probable LRR receptor-like serine/threonine-protein kinase At1g34110 [Physcomitrium patens]PNR62588.1 hypothetical protein PHYPA_001012 [Physcomitrium patens]|eukprot:XP_024395550.1 probable LRR receptor-like serine/threonine-protein kinase At1g34110 [Physcomitrella patens]
MASSESKIRKDLAASCVRQFFTLATYFVLTIGLLSVHIGAAISVGEVGLKPSTGRRVLAVNSTRSVLEDGEALLQIKAAITDDPTNATYWWKRTGAKQTLNPCRMKNYTKQYWPGIDCTDKRVTSINLANMSLKGTLSPYLGALSSLKQLDLSNNLLTGAIPVELAQATNLETLNLGNNRLDGELPTFLGNMRNLTSINVANNLLVGSIPTSIGNMSVLQRLNMSTNNLTGPIPAVLNLCARLTLVDLSRNGLQGPVPFQSLGNLTLLNLRENDLTGDFVTKLATFPKLQDLDLSFNRLTGSIPANISTLPLTNQLSLAYNQLSGMIPIEIGGLAVLQRINLSTNLFTGILPETVGSLSALRELDASSNQLIGPLPDSLSTGVLTSLVVLNVSRNALGGRLPHLARLKNTLRVFDASYNNLSGPVPDDFVDYPSLLYLNVSHNNLRGDVPFFQEHDGVNTSSFIHNQVCGRNFVLIKVCRNRSEEDRSNSRKNNMVAILVGAAVAFVVAFGTAVYCCNKSLRQNKTIAKDTPNVSVELGAQVTPEDIMRLTINFNEQNKLGAGSLGTVYRAILPDESVVAVKSLAIQNSEINTKVEQAIANGFESLGHLRHWSLVKLLNYCCSPDINAIVMEYMPNGTLNNMLYPTSDDQFGRVFNWHLRLNAAITIAEGLNYLHHECPTPTVHGDLKPSNILFNIFMEARVSDFGVAKILRDQGVGAGRVAYASGYVAPEVSTEGPTIKGDVYSFGIVLLEMISGRSPQSLANGQTLPRWIRETLTDSKTLPNVLDKILKEQYEEKDQKISMVVGVALMCTRDNPEERPYINAVLKDLNRIKARTEAGSRAGSMRWRSSPSTHRRNEEIRQEVPGITMIPSPPITPPGGAPPPPLPINALTHTPSLSNWTPSHENR